MLPSPGPLGLVPAYHTGQGCWEPARKLMAGRGTSDCSYSIPLFVCEDRPDPVICLIICKVTHKTLESSYKWYHVSDWQPCWFSRLILNILRGFLGHWKQAQPKMCHSPKVENRVDNQFSPNSPTWAIRSSSRNVHIYICPLSPFNC